MSYLLATTEEKVRWYKFDPAVQILAGEFSLVSELDLALVPTFPDKEAARHVAQALGLKTWRYVRI